MNPSVLHATAIARWRAGAWLGLLLRGGSGAGKSSVALRAMEAGWRLVADDRCLVWASGGRLFCRAPTSLDGLIEARGLGVLPAPRLAWAPIGLVVDLADGPGAVERLPEPEWETLAAVRLPLVRIWPHDGAATAKLALALACAATQLGAAWQQAYQAPRADDLDEGAGAHRGPPERNR